MRGLQTRHWLESALHRTAVPFTVTAGGLALIGYALHAYAPEAQTPVPLAVQSPFHGLGFPAHAVAADAPLGAGCIAAWRGLSQPAL